MTARILGAVTASLLAATLAACGTESAGSAGSGGDPVRLGVTVGLTGYIVNFDTGVRNGIDLAAATLNASGGIAGRPIEVFVEDMESDPQAAVLAVQRLINEREVTAVLGGFHSAGTAASAPVLNQGEVPMVVASVLPQDPAFVFSTIPSVQYELQARIGYLQEKGIKSVGILYDATPYNKLQLEKARELLGAAGITITSEEQHTPDAADLRPQVARLLAGGPGAVWKLSGGPTHIVAARAMAGSDLPLMLSIENIDIIRQAAQVYPSTFFVAAPPQVYSSLRPEEVSDSLREFMENPAVQGDATYVGRGWDAVYILAEAMKRAGGDPTGPALRDALVGMEPFVGASGTYDFTDASHYGLSRNPLYLGTFTPDGQTAIAYRPAG
jgi:branched-chain amino acid transport system substrate-binding protein